MMRRFANLVPDFLKPFLRPFWKVYLTIRTYRRRLCSLYFELTNHQRTQPEFLQYWSQPNNGNNQPIDYTHGEERSIFLVDLVSTYIEPEARILEIGSNVGRNLNQLFIAGYKNIEGIEINSEAVRLSSKYYPEMSKCATIHNGCVEDLIKQFDSKSFDLIFTMACLMHIHKDSAFIFREMVKVSKRLIITVEDEKIATRDQFPRNYQKVFEPLSCRQVEKVSRVKGMVPWYVLRVFEKVT